MILEDVEHIFKPQIDEGTDKLYFMLIDGEHKMIERHAANDLATLVPLLDAFQYIDTIERVPRFSK
jgi:hypothetical protein